MTCFAEAGGQHVPEMARAVELLGLRACLTESIMDTGEGLPASWAIRTTDDCIQVIVFFLLQFTCPCSVCKMIYLLCEACFRPYCIYDPLMHPHIYWTFSFMSKLCSHLH